MIPRVGVISVGGRGARLGRPDIQKCLIEVGGKPLLEYTVEAFVQSGIKVIFLLTGFLSEQVDDYLASRASDTDYVLKSVFGGIDGQVVALLKLQHSLGEDFLYAAGDCVFSPNIVRALIRDTSQYKTSAAIMAANEFNETVISHPRIELKGRSRFVESVKEPGAIVESNLVGMGMYYFRPRIFEFLSKITANPLSRPSEFFKHAQEASESVAVSIAAMPWLCLHTPRDFSILQSLDIEAFLKAV